MSGKLGSSSFGVLLVDGYNLLGAKPKNFSYKKQAAQERSEGLGDSVATQHPTGMLTYTMSQAGAFFDDTTSGQHDAVKSKQAIARVLTGAYGGNSIGSRAIGVSGDYILSYEVLGQIGLITKANVTHQISGTLEEGIVLQEHATRTDDWDTYLEGHTVDNGASSANGGAGYIEVSNFLGPNTGLAVIRHSDDGVTWSTLLTFTVINGAPTAERVAVAGTVKRYLSFKWFGFGNISASASSSASVSPSVSASISASASISPSTSRSPSASTSLSPSSSISPSASTSLSPSTSISPSVSASASQSFSLSPSVSTSASVSPSSGGVQASSVTVFAMFARL